MAVAVFNSPKFIKRIMKKRKFKRAKPKKTNKFLYPRLVFWLGVVAWIAYVVSMVVIHVRAQ